MAGDASILVDAAEKPELLARTPNPTTRLVVASPLQPVTTMHRTHGPVTKAHHGAIGSSSTRCTDLGTANVTLYPDAISCVLGR
jgi:hypothetical protein